MNNDHELKRIQIEMFCEFIKICENNNITYFLLGGSCLGAIRHKGYIPWDDDIDVGIPRPDYDRFLQIAQKQLPDNIFLQTFETDKNYTQNYAKLRRSDTTFIETLSKNLDINHGIYMDIFPLDGASKSNLKTSLDFLRIKLLTYKIYEAYQIEKKLSIKAVLLNIVNFFYAPTIHKAIEKKDKIIRRYPYESSSIIANWCGAWGKKEVMPKSIFADGTTSSFENIEVVIPKEYDQYLTRMYGDYMELPPEEKRVSHHDNEVIDTTKSYKEYIK